MASSVHSTNLPACGRHNFRQSLGRVEPGQFRRREPMGLRQFLIERNLAGDPARSERHNDEMPLDAPCVVAGNDLAVAGGRQRLISRPVSSRTSRTTASASVSPSSTAPPGSV